MISSPRRKQFTKKCRKASLKSDYNSIYVTSIKESPYYDKTFLPISPPPLISTKRKTKTQPIIFPNLSYTRYNRSPRKFASTFDSLHASNPTGSHFKIETDNHDTINKYHQSLKLGSSYEFEYLHEYKMSKIRTAKILDDSYNEEIQKRRNLNRQTKEAIRESYNHDLYYQDNIHSPHNKTLRIIPVTDRYNSLIAVKEQPLV